MLDAQQKMWEQLVLGDVHYNTKLRTCISNDDVSIWVRIISIRISRQQSKGSVNKEIKGISICIKLYQKLCFVVWLPSLLGWAYWPAGLLFIRFRNSVLEKKICFTLKDSSFYQVVLEFRVTSETGEQRSRVNLFHWKWLVIFNK